MPSSELEDIERGLPEPGGYERLAGYMSRHPELGIFRRFGALGHENLLYYQAELSRLEVRLRFVQARDRASDNEHRKQYGRAWIRLSESAKSDDPVNSEQYNLIMSLRELMGEYRRALFYHKQTLALRRPHRKLLEDLQGWMRRPDLGDISISSCDWRTWEPNEEIENDLLTFEDSTMDEFTSLITYTVVDVYHKLLGRRIHKKGLGRENTSHPLTYSEHRHTVTYPHRTIARITRVITVSLACMLPVGAIVLLYTVEDMTMRLIVIAALTGVFSISMNVFTMATLSEIFAATAAFAAVQVVFLGAANGG
ncbi:hypothetical protein F5Y04DRAFT_281007 [Hypomontagnella monticulosa]|nr:hypothetical protein F5Y04DRAFT_281007 [Hypomontagnella monticulosa]